MLPDYNVCCRITTSLADWQHHWRMELFGVVAVKQTAAHGAPR
jgi:hypothetical protein